MYYIAPKDASLPKTAKVISLERRSLREHLPLCFTAIPPLRQLNWRYLCPI
jgi:hypothetical protein